MTSDATVAREQMTTSDKRLDVVLNNVSCSYQEVKRPLIEPNEVMRLPRSVKGTSNGKIIETGGMLVFVTDYSMICGRQIPYFADPIFSKRLKLKPMPIGIVRKVSGQPVTIAPAPEDEAISQRGSLVASRLNAASKLPSYARPR